ncbi:phage replisome organizer N-terminal domain-containing protein [Enterococcus casseliflavus]|uniref:phage replisome organizer N-terminal domain-containing protein n=1 Tax=Enterococcus TaxID=1350 RepID=UPI00232F1A47|nr:phage replisome organizer N-terminal domain-containing protein [Enterococcus innesii]MDC0752461.1 phage replisome organizer N-terminal domain-containing protein [Enterococcus innesii]MDC0776640.1 phage replisome organizer N-terminal domain-containing protein [Enterococcus innesii]MDC0779156.1 phage replisome organizer N-terminal domain-containing protein [Enterococcus innesii]MDC0783642.1 phage replisome organizer N-terminal domain-containing protein [Enterococcus innesii]
MADNKKYYYLKLKDNFFDSDEMIILESMPDGYIYSNILLKLYLRSLKYQGRLMFNDKIPFNSTMLAQVTRHSVGDVEKSIRIFNDLGLIEVLDNGAIYLADIQNFIGESSTEADRKRGYRQRIELEKQALLTGGQMSDKCPDKNPPEIEIELEKDIEIEKEIKKEPKKKNTTRHKYGEYKNVLLSDDQLEKLKSEFPNDWEQRIDRVSEYCESTGKTYKNYLATIRNWAKKDKTQPNQPIRKKQPYVRQETLPEWANEPVNYSRNKPKVTEEDRRRFLDVSGREEGF